MIHYSARSKLKIIADSLKRGTFAKILYYHISSESSQSPIMFPAVDEVSFSKELLSIVGLTFDRLSLDWHNIYKTQQPIVIRNLINNWPAVSDNSRSWGNLESLKERVHQETMVDIEIGDSYMDPDVKKISVDLKSYIDFLINSEKIKGNKEIRKVYLAQFELKNIKELSNDVKTPLICQITGKGDIYGNKIWFGSDLGTVSPCHYDPYNNILCQVFGSKSITLFAPEYSNNLYPLLHTVQKNTSDVNIENPDYYKHPLFKEIKGFQTVLNKGDALFIPYKYWHYCKTQSLSCSVNYWWL